MSAMRSGDGDVSARRHGAYGEVRVGLTERHGSDGERLAALENHAALPGLPAARRDADAPHPRRRCDGHRRRAAVDAVHTDVRALRNGRHRERSPCGLQPHVQLLTRAGSLDAERGGVVDVARRAQADGTVARGHADHTGSQSRGDAVDADRGHDSRGVDLQLARELREHQAESLRAAPVHDERCLRRKVPLALRAHAEREGYLPAEAALVVHRGGAERLRLVLAKLPGQLQIDTAGVVAAVSIDGVAAGLAPGVISVPAGDRTISLRAPRYVDYTTTLGIEGAGARQELHVRLQPAWGTLAVTAVPQGAHVSVDGVDSGAAPVSVAAPSGVRRIRIAASGWKTWESSVVLKGGQTLAVGPVTLGQPDAHLTVRSVPAGADVTIAGTHRGHTPLTVELPAGIAYPVVLSLPGYATWTRELFATAGSNLSAEARLAAVLASVKVSGEPADAELLVDGAPRGQTPQSLLLPAVEHRLEVRKAGFIPFEAVLTPVPELERAVQYHLTPSDRGRALLESAPLIRSQIGYVLRLVPPGAFQMGSERREQERRPNEGLRTVTLQRPFYIGVLPVTNGDFRRFRPEHASGYIDRQSIDLDSQPVTQVSWEDAAEFCNWLSHQDGLPPAYQRSGTSLALARPVTRGYRLPTEAEWEYAGRYGPSGQSYRFAWGDSPPVPLGVGNLAGGETGSSLPATLPGYRDDYPVVSPVGKFHPTALGLHDMSGNVSQWVNDYYESFVDPAPMTDPLGPAQGTLHVVRGASWKTASVSELRLAWRDTASGPEPTVGFRLARYADDPQ